MQASKSMTARSSKTASNHKGDHRLAPRVSPGVMWAFELAGVFGPYVGSRESMIEHIGELLRSGRRDRLLGLMAAIVRQYGKSFARWDRQAAEAIGDLLREFGNAIDEWQTTPEKQGGTLERIFQMKKDLKWAANRKADIYRNRAIAAVFHERALGRKTKDTKEGGINVFEFVAAQVSIPGTRVTAKNVRDWYYAVLKEGKANGESPAAVEDFYRTWSRTVDQPSPILHRYDLATGRVIEDKLL